MDRLGRLLVREPLRELQHRHRGEPPRGLSRLAATADEFVAKRLIPEISYA